MRSRIAGAVIGLIGLVAPAMATPPSDADREAFRAEWHRCVRQAFSVQAAGVEKRAAERAALSACKAQEDAYVAAELAGRQAELDARRKGSLATRAKAWMSSAAAYFVDPLAGFFDGLGR